MPVSLDPMEYPTHILAQEAYVSSDAGYGSDVLTGGTASVDTIFGAGYEAAKGADDNLGTRWASTDSAFPHWWKYDLGAGVAKVITKLRINKFWNISGSALKDFTLQGSNNDSDWDVVYTGQAAEVGADGVWEEFTFQNSVAFRYYKLNVTSTYRVVDEIVSFWEIEGMETNLQCYSEDTIVKEGTYSLKGVATITVSLNETLMRTVDPTIDLSGQNFVLFWMRASRTGTNLQLRLRDSGGTWSSYNIVIFSANTWEMKEWNISGVASANRNAIDRIELKIIEASADNIFYTDNMYGEVGIILAESVGLLESLPTIERQLTLEEAIALIEVSKIPFGPDVVLQEALALKNVSNVPACPDIILAEALALKESLTEISRALLLTEAIALKESLPVTDRQLPPLEETIAFIESLPVIHRELPPFEEAIALKPEIHAEALLFKIDKSGNITYMGTLDGGSF